ncbi:MAG TPA: peptide chain release factor N(5)-glutamine methyltransferase [Candidatus Limnocylindrales bacterium]
MPTVDELVSVGIARLRAAGDESPRLDAELLLAHVLGTDRTTIVAHPEAQVGNATAVRYHEVVGRREAGEPVAYIHGTKEFRGLAFGTDPRALIPRPETEQLVELAEAEVIGRLTSAPRPPGSPKLRVLDVGTGSGVIAVSLAVALRRRRMLDEVEVRATDVTADAVQLARENAVAHAVADVVLFEVADLLPETDTANARWDLVLANLPYIPTAAIPDLPRPTSFEPVNALDGGPDGLAVIGRLVDRLPDVLAEGGVVLLEIGGDQGPAMSALVAERLPGWRCEIRLDLARLPRIARIARAA